MAPADILCRTEHMISAKEPIDNNSKQRARSLGRVEHGQPLSLYASDQRQIGCDESVSQRRLDAYVSCVSLFVPLTLCLPSSRQSITRTRHCIYDEPYMHIPAFAAVAVSNRPSVA